MATIKKYNEGLSTDVSDFITELQNKFPDVRVTSGFRKGAKTKQGKASRHSTGEAIDVTPTKDMYEYLLNTEEGLGLLNKYNLGILDETTPEMLKKTGGTNAHYHIGRDSSLVNSAKERYNKIVKPKPQQQNVFQIPTVGVTNLPESKENTNIAPENKEQQVILQPNEQDFLAEIDKIYAPQEEAQDTKSAVEIPTIRSLSDIINQSNSFVNTEVAQQGKKINLRETNYQQRDNTAVNNILNARLFNPQVRNKTDKEIAAERLAKINSSNAIRNSDKTLGWRKRLAEETKATGEKLRVSLEPNFFDDYLNPVAMVGSMASNLGQSPLQAEQTDSILPYVTSIGTPLVAGALGGLGTKSTGQFVNNMANPLAGTGDLVNSLGNKYLPNAYKLNPYAFKPKSNTFYRQIGDGVDALESGVIRSADQQMYPRPNFVEGKDFNKLNSTGSGASNKNNMIAEMPMVKDGEMTAYQSQVNSTYSPYQANLKEVPLSDVNLYEKDWLKGYKQIEVPKKQQGGDIKTTPLGQYQYPGEVTRIPSPNITMKNVPYDIVGVSEETGEKKLMKSNQDYFFKNTKNVVEYPVLTEAEKQFLKEISQQNG